MNYDINDPKWTAYALGEITDEQERAEIEKILAEAPELRALVEDIRLTAGLLKEEFNAEPEIQLTSAQKEKIEAKASADRTWFGLKPVWVSSFATAAVLLVVSMLALRQFDKLKTDDSRDQIASIMNKDKAPAQVQGLNSFPESKAVAGNSLQREAFLQADKAFDLPENPSSVEMKSSSASQPVASTESLSVKGTGIQSGTVQTPPLAGNNVKDLINVMGGVVKTEQSVAGNNTSAVAGVQAGNLNIQRDGVTVNEVRYKGGTVVGGIPGGVAGGAAGGVVGGVLSAAIAPAPAPQPVRRSPAYPYPPTPPHWPREREWRPVPPVQHNTETYDNIRDNPFLDVLSDPLSTFSIDVDTASYSNVRRFLNEGKMPPKDAVRIEELVNYFDYDYKTPKDGKPFAANFEMTEAPWNPEHRLLRIALKGKDLSEGRRPDSNLVFLLDVSGSMADANKLPLVKQSMKMLTDRLTESDRVAIVVYATDTQVWLPSTSGVHKERIRQAIDRLFAGGSTNGASGIQLAYQEAKNNFIKKGVNRVILCTDGDFNVGMTNRGDLTRLIEEKSKSGIYLSALGFGMGNYKDATLETLANKGHGNYAYIDTENEARKVLVEQINSTLVSIAKDVKIQVEFNPKYVASYRLIGYEDRLMAREDFNDDTKEAGVIGAGHAVTAFYELIPPGAADARPRVDPLKYQKQPQVSTVSNSSEVVTVKVRSKDPEKDVSVLSEFPIKDSVGKFAKASADFKFGAAVAAFGMALRDSPYKGKINLESVLAWAKEGKGEDRYGYRQEFIRLVHRAYSFSD